MDLEKIRQDFPILQVRHNGKPIIYMDNAATSQKPKAVIDVISQYYTQQNSNVHRGVHCLSQLATGLFEGARKKVQRFLNAASDAEIVFTRGTTESINLVAHSFVRPMLNEGDEVLITWMEHHSNIVPWQMLCEEKGTTLKVVPINDRGELIMEEFEKLLTERTKIVGVVHVSNALGTINPIEDIIRISHAKGVPVLVDAAQSTPHMKVDVQALDCDFLALSGHKMFGPTGIGVLYGKAKHLKHMPPYQGGGDMILAVSFERTVYNRIPHKFEAGTPHIEGVIGLGAAIDYLESVGMDHIAAYEQELLSYGTAIVQDIPGLRLIGTADQKASVLSFVLESAHAHDVGQILDDEGVAIRVGHHCAQPVMERFGVPATARASLAFYNTREELDVFAEALHKVNKVFA
ncbi:MAG: cysteine desulfurase [Candidatus Hydrogenedentes bacterium]|nr:cysteine desulfurase [Candidatus Hydrogenedentota bacterium]